MLSSSAGPFGKSKNYAVAATFNMVDMGKYSTSYGYLGIAFNMMDSKNYDIAYVRFLSIFSELFYWYLNFNNFYQNPKLVEVNRSQCLLI